MSSRRTGARSIAWPRTNHEGQPLDGGSSQPDLIYIEWEEALALFAEIRGLSLEAAVSELRDVGLLQSAMARPRHAAQYAEADIAEQAATLLWGIAQNQPFVDGNKRTALVVTLTFLELNGYRLDFSQDQLADLLFEIADGLSVLEVGARLRSQLRARDRGEP